MKNEFHSKPVDEVLKNLSSNEKGLSKDEVKNRVEKHGENDLPERGGEHPATIFLKQFKNILIYVLIAAAGISYFANHRIDAYVIITVVLVNAIMGFFQEYKAMKSIDALRKMIVHKAKVIRGGELTQVNAKELVPGDIIFIEEGDRVPADARIIHSRNFRTVEASLTGESVPVNKYSKPIPQNVGMADRKNMVFMGTFAVGGEARAVVTKTGMDTEIGKIAESISRIKHVKGHFEKKIDTLVKQMGVIAGVSALLVFLTGYLIRGFEFYEIFMFTVASLVSGIPEGLPAILVIVLAMGAHRMSRRNAIIRTLPATETLGVTTVIATDKTGTLTKSTMNVEGIFLPEEKEFKVTGEGWKPVGEFFQKGKKIEPLKNKRLSKFLHISALCNNSVLEKDGEEYKIVGDPTEASMVVLAEKAGLKKDVVSERKKRIDDLPFCSKVKYRASLSTLVKEGNRKEIYVIGAPEEVISKCSEISGIKKDKKITKKDRDEIRNVINGFAKSGMRVLGLAYKKVSSSTTELKENMIEELTFAGLVGMKDPVRPGVKEAIQKTKKAGIRVIMKTGDHKDTALAIAKEIGLVDEKESGKYPQVMTESDIVNLSEEEFKDVVRNVSVFARLTPNMKLKLVETLQEQGEIVAMTGDGVNDAPALKKADIGIGMGIAGTDVAKESSSMILADDNFTTIVDAIEEGRTVFANTRNSSSFLVTTNFAEEVSIIASLAMGFPLLLLPAQILWINIVTDTTSAAALAFEPPQAGVLEQPPKKKEENILSREVIPFVLIMTAIMAVLTLSIFSVFLGSGVDKARTGAFVVMAFTQLFNFLNMRSLKNSIFKIGFFSNKIVPISFVVSLLLLGLVLYVPFLQEIFRFDSLSLTEIIVIFGLSSTVFWAGELYKKIKFNK